MDKAKVPEDASMYICETGEHPIIESKEVKRFSEKFPIYLNSYEVLNNEFYKLSRQLSGQYEELSVTQKKLSECCKHLSTMFKLCNSEKSSQYYSKVGDVIKNWSKFSKNYNDVIKDHMVDFYKYMSLGKNALSELQKLSVTATQNYLKAEAVLTKKKEKLFVAGNPSLWELSEADAKRAEDFRNNKSAAFEAMLPRETIKLQHLKTNHLMLCTQCYIQVKSSNKYDLEWTYNNFSEVSQKLENIYNQEIDNVRAIGYL